MNENKNNPKKILSRREINEFLNKAYAGDERIIQMLETEPAYRDVGIGGLNVFSHLFVPRADAIIKVILERNLSSYSCFKSAMERLMHERGNKYETSKELFYMLHKKDRDEMILRAIGEIIASNSKDTLDAIDLECLTETLRDEKTKRSLYLKFQVFTKCEDKTLEKCIHLYRSVKFADNDIIQGFKIISDNKLRTVTLIENLANEITPELYKEIQKVNKHCTIHLDNKGLKEKLDTTLSSSSDNIGKPKTPKI